MWGAVIGTVIGGAIGSIIPGVGTAVGIGIGASLGGSIGGGVDAKLQSDDIVAKQKQAGAAQVTQSQTSGRRQAAAIYNQAAASGTSSSMVFTMAKLQREAKTNFANIRDSGIPFSPVDDKATKLAHNYGKPIATKVIA